MAQKYKVFIERKPIIYSQGTEKHPLEIEEFLPSCNKATYERLADTVKRCNHEIIWHTPNPEKTMYTFFQQFKQIKAAGGIVYRYRNSKLEYLFIERLGHLDLPKGKIDKNEHPLAAAQREIMEECGIQNLQLTHPLQSSYHTYFMHNNHVLKECCWFLFSYSGDEKLTPQFEEDITAANWMQEETIIKQLDNTYPSLVDVILEAFEIMKNL